jgi:hypothetical protein
LNTIALTLKALRQGLDDAGLNDKVIGYTTRFNAFWDDNNRPEGAMAFNSDGEGIIIDNHLREFGLSIKEVVSFTNVMMYDVPPNQLGAPNNKFTL